jgi:peptide/nickel transport system permease protein
MTTSAALTGPAKLRIGPGLLRYLRAFRSGKGIAGLGLLLLLIALALLAPVISPAGPNAQGDEFLTGPSLAHLLGTDEVGRDLLARTLFGLRTDLSLILTAVPLSMVIGTLLGLCGVVSERLGVAVQRLLDVIVGFPTIILGICIVAVLGVGWLSLFLAILVHGLPSIGRLARNALLEQRDREYVIAARVLGVRKSQIMLRHILPNAVDPIIVNGAVLMVVGVYIEAGLSIVGLGIQPPTPSLGTLLNNGMRYIDRSPTYIIGAGVVLLLLALSFSLIADALNRTVTRR